MILTKLINKLDIRIKVIKLQHKIFENVFTMSPDDKNIVNVPKQYKKLKLLSLVEITFHLIHKYSSIRWGILSAYCCS